MEVCVDNIESVISADKGGAMRIELCSSLVEGGLTPSVGFLRVAKANTQIPIFVMIRPRGGNFVYSDDEVLIMAEDIQILKQNGADGFVLGLLTETGEVDKVNCELLLSYTGGLPTTFHRAFDEVAYPFKSLEDVISLGFKRILTSGLKATALEGLPVIKELIKAAKQRIIIMPGSGVNKENVLMILQVFIYDYHFVQ